MQCFFRLFVAVGAIALILISLARLEAARSELNIIDTQLGETPATLYNADGNGDRLVVVSHGFAGSRQMMEAISLSLARAGHSVVAFDYLGHGRHEKPLSPNITSLTGTTEDLVRQTVDVVDRARALTGHERLALVGHSMATDVIVRAASRVQSVEEVVAISMYSEAVTPDHPERLLVLSGAQEGRLRSVALSAVEQLGKAEEGVTLRKDGVERRAAVAPMVGHVGVLWSPVTIQEILRWIGEEGEPARTGRWIAALLGAIFALFWPLSHLLPDGPSQPGPSLRRAILSVLIPAPFAILASCIDLPMRGLSGFGALFLFFAIWGTVALAVLRWRPRVEVRPALISFVLLVVWGLGAFALSLDRYGAAFLPTGPRLPLMMLLLPATLIFALADRACVQGRHPLTRVALRLPFLLALSGAMMLNIADIGLLFTVLPVFVLFLVVYGTMARWAEDKAGPLGPAVASGLILAWSIAASTPLFAAA
ncbi:MAG: alpha/beta fold hydrolase [Sulfitobacter sp.]|nr:alpha/beta fold hydrolase [Sulfitobacter sp.]